jgi:hypothetical protein
MFRRAKIIGWIDYLDGFWLDWERWFTEVEESHTSYLALSFFRSPHHQRSWVTAAGAVLDSAALRVATMDLPRSWQAQLCSAPDTWHCGASPGPTASATTPTRRRPIPSP